MCPTAGIVELLGRQQRGKTGNSQPESRGAIGNSCYDTEYIAEAYSPINEIEPSPIKTTIFHTKKESMIVKADEDPRKPWYFTHV